MKSISLTIATILVIAVIVIAVGIFYVHNILSNKFISMIIYNTQSIPTPSPFQQDIAICNGSINIGNNFAYINNPILFNKIDPNGQNVYFVNSSRNMLYSWYEGQLSINNVTCDVWWINLPNGIPANSNITIYMYIGSNSSNYYSQYYPYVGTNEQVIGTMQYDNGNYTFIAYGYFNNTFDGWKGYVYNGSFSPKATPLGIEMLNGNPYEGTYILPPNNGNIPKIPLIVEEAWYYILTGHANVIALFGNTSQQIGAGLIGNIGPGETPVSNLSTFADFDYYFRIMGLTSAVTNRILDLTYFSYLGGTFYLYLIVNSTYAETGYYLYNWSQVWAPLTLLDTYSLLYNPNYGGDYIYSNLNYNPFQYPTLEISAGDGYYGRSYQCVEWVVARAYPPNGVMPSIYIS